MAKRVATEKRRAQTRQWAKDNPEKHQEYRRKWRENNADKRREQARKWAKENISKTRRYRGMPVPTRPEAEFCECCSRWFLSITPQLDHDHLTGRFRGWLCKQCNVGIGMLGDDVAGLEKAIAYLKRVEKEETA